MEKKRELDTSLPFQRIYKNCLQKLDMALRKRKQLVELLDSLADYDGVSMVTQDEIAQELGISRSRISQMINQLNTVDMCIERIGKGSYKVHYTNVESRGIFALMKEKLPEMILLLPQESFLSLKKQEKADLLGIPAKVYEVLEGYVRNEF